MGVGEITVLGRDKGWCWVLSGEARMIPRTRLFRVVP